MGSPMLLSRGGQIIHAPRQQTETMTGVVKIARRIERVESKTTAGLRVVKLTCGVMILEQLLTPVSPLVRRPARSLASQLAYSRVCAWRLTKTDGQSNERTRRVFLMTECRPGSWQTPAGAVFDPRESPRQSVRSARVYSLLLLISPFSFLPLLNLLFTIVFAQFACLNVFDVGFRCLFHRLHF